MSDEVVNILHRITYEVHDRELEQAVRTVNGNIAGIENLTRRQIRLAEQFNRTGVQDVQTRQRINRLINQNTTALNHHRRSLEDNLVSNRSLNNALNQELGIIGNLERRLQILSQARRRATSQTEIDRYNGLINRTQNQLNATNPAQNVNRNGGLLSSLGLGTGGGAIARLLPMIGGAIGISQLGSQIKDVTQRFESYRTTLRNTFQSSIKANEEFAKIKEFAEVTPFGVDELTASFIKLVNRGFVPTKDELTNIGDLAASQGKSFDQLVEAILDAQTGEFERLKEFGIKARTSGDMVTLSFKGIEKQVKKTDEQALRNAVISFGKLQGVAGGMNAQARTLGGTISNLGDSFDSLFSAIGERGISPFNSLLSVVKETVDWFTKIIEKSPADSFREQQAELNNLVSQLILTNDQEELRSIVMSEITAKYPEFLNLIGQEQASTEQLASALSVLNQQYEHKIRLAKLAEESEVVSKKKTDLYGQRLDAIQTLTPELKKHGYTEVSFMSLSKSEQEKVGKRILSELEQSKRKSAKKKNTDGSSAKDLYNIASEVDNVQTFKQNWSDFERVNNKLTAEQNRITGLIDAENKSYLAGQKEELKAAQNKLVLLKKNKAKQSEIATQESIIQGIKDMINPPKPKVTKPTDTKKKKTKTKKAKDPNQIALDNIDKQMKIEQEQEKQLFEQRKSQLLSNLESELIDRETYNQRLTEAVEDNAQKLLQIELKYANLRPKYLKQAEKEANKTRIDELNNSFKEYADTIRKRSEQLIKQLIDDQKNIDDEIFKLTADSRAKDILSNKRSTKNKTDELTEQIKTYRNQVSELNLRLLNPDSTTIKEDTEQKEQIEKNLYSLNILRAKIVEDGRIKEREINLKYDLQELDDLKDLMQNKLDIYTDAEQKRFFELYQEKLDNNERELLLLRNKLAKEDLEILPKNKKRKAKKQHDKDLEELEYRTSLANLNNNKIYFEGQIKTLKKGYDDLTKEEKKGRDKQIKSAKANLGSTQNEIKKKEDDKKKKEEEDDDRSWGEKFNDFYSEFNNQVSSATTAASTFIDVLQSTVDQEISIRERRVEKLKKIAERGNAELLQLEEKRLQKAQAQQEKYARTQIAINAIQTTSESVLAIAKAASAGGGWGSIALVLATIGALASGFAMVKSLTQDNISGFKDGIVNLNGPGNETSDSIPARLSRGESVITAKGTKAGDNAEILRMMNDGMAFSVPNLMMKNPNIGVISPSDKQNDFKTLESKLDNVTSTVQKVVEAVENQKPSSFSIDQDGVVAMTNAVNEKKRKRDLL